MTAAPPLGLSALECPERHEPMQPGDLHGVRRPGHEAAGPHPVCRLLQRVCQEFPPKQEDYATLQGYLDASTSQPEGTPTSLPSLGVPATLKRHEPDGCPAGPTLRKKRKAEEELPPSSDRHLSGEDEHREDRGFPFPNPL